MVSPLIHGIALGFGTALMIGPVFFTLLKNSMQGRKLYGILTALGIITSDIIVVIICLLLSQEFLIYYVNQLGFQLFGIAILIFIGISFIIKPIELPTQNSKLPSKQSLKTFIQGFSINFINPAVFLIWIGFIAIGNQKFTEKFDVYTFIIGILFGIFSTDILKVFAAVSISKYLKSNKLVVFSKILGLVLITIALFILAKVILSF